MNKWECVVDKKPVKYFTGTVWVPELRKHITAGFCSNKCEKRVKSVLKPHIPKLRKGTDYQKKVDPHQHNSVYCFGIYIEQIETLASRGG